MFELYELEIKREKFDFKDGVLGIRMLDSWLESTDESTELWRAKFLEILTPHHCGQCYKHLWRKYQFPEKYKIEKGCR